MDWLTAKEIAELENLNLSWVLRKYSKLAMSRNGSRDFYMRSVTINSRVRIEFHIDLLPENLRTICKARTNAAGSHGDEETTIQGKPSSITTALQTPAQSRQPAASPEVARASARQLELALLEKDRESILGPVPESKRPLAWARWRIIEPLVSGAWRKLTGQTVHGIPIRRMEDYVQALAKDSKRARGQNGSGSDRGFPNSPLHDWRGIEAELREAHGGDEVAAAIRPLSPRTIWRLYAWHQHGRALLGCSECRGEIDQKTCLCERCQSRQALPPGIEALVNLDRSDKGKIDILPEHARFLIAAFTGGDSSVPKARLALERPRSIEQCLEMLKLEIEFGRQPGPAPSIYRARRVLREYLPASVRDYGRLGRRRALELHDPWIARDRAEHQVNDLWYCDFRRSNIRVWIEADEDARLYRLYLCAIMDVASRDVIFRFDLYPSTNLFKSTLRRALGKWGVPKQIWMDNGKEFIAEEISGGQTYLRKWRFRSDKESDDVFSKFGIEAHYCKIKNPTGKAPLERFFQQFDSIERELPGWTGENTLVRPERLSAEEKDHAAFCAHELRDTPLLSSDQLIRFHTDWIELKYRHDGHAGLRGCSPAQLQARSAATRRIPNADELTILLWHRKRLKAHGDKISFHYHRATFLYRADELLALPGNAEVEVHVDPLSADRALAITDQGRVIRLAPVDPSGRSPAELEQEYQHKAQLEKKLRQATLVASRLARVPSAEERLEMYRQRGERKQAGLDRGKQSAREEFSLPEYAEAAKTMQEPEVRGQTPEENHKPVFTSYAEAKAWESQQKSKRG